MSDTVLYFVVSVVAQVIEHTLKDRRVVVLTVSRRIVKNKKNLPSITIIRDTIEKQNKSPRPKLIIIAIALQVHGRYRTNIKEYRN